MPNCIRTNFVSLQSFSQFMDKLNNTWTKRFGDATHQHDPRDALFGYDAMWLGALALDMAETKLKNVNLTLDDFQYTGENGRMIMREIAPQQCTGGGLHWSKCERSHVCAHHILPPASPMYNAWTVNSTSVFLYTTGLHQAPPQWGQKLRAAIFSVSAYQ